MLLVVVAGQDSLSALVSSAQYASDGVSHSKSWAYRHSKTW